MATRSKLHCYVINLPKCQDRKERMINRLTYHKLLDKTTFIEAIDQHSPLVDWIQTGVSVPLTSRKCEHACFLSHLKALKAFVANDDVDEAIILEDDAMLHNEFEDRLSLVIDNCKGANLIMLCFLAFIDRYPILRIIDNPSEPDKTLAMFRIGEYIFGAQAYWITKKYAAEILVKLNQNIGNLGEKFVTSELITRLSGGYFIAPPLAIEDTVYSTLRMNDEITRHRDFFRNFGMENYNKGDDIDPREIWKPVGYNPLTSKE